jgi:hypothetical protein
LKDLRDALNKSNDDRLAVLRELSDNIKELLKRISPVSTDIDGVVGSINPRVGALQNVW